MGNFENKRKFKMEMLKNNGLVHTSTKLPWLILALSILSPMSISTNSYQAEGGSCLKTYFLGYVCHIVMGLGIAFWWVLLIPLLCAVLAWAFGIFHGYTVMQISK